MIEKLEKFDPTEASIYHVERLYAKVNEIIDLLNAIVVDVDGTKCVDGSKKAEPDFITTTYMTDGHIKEYYGQKGASIVTDHPLPAGYVITIKESETRAENVQPDAESRPENVQDKFAEQRKWIGKLCKFWDIDNNNLYYGPLTKIHDTSPYCYECNHKMCYANCEPVSEDLIYKGGDNE